MIPYLIRSCGGFLGCRFIAFCTAFAVALLVLTDSSVSQAGFPEPVVRVEEDWELVLDEPSDVLTAPQFHTVMSPFSNVDSFLGQVIWNYRELPDFCPGGIQMQVWSGDSLFREKSFGWGSLSTNAEAVTWTQALATDGTNLSFTIRNGQSTTWGTFGYPGQNMKIQGDANLPDLNGYDSDVSVNNSCVTFGANRVVSLKIREVRRYGPSGLLSIDQTPRVVFEREE